MRKKIKRIYRPIKYLKSKEVRTWPMTPGFIYTSEFWWFMTAIQDLIKEQQEGDFNG